ncbi:phenylalanine--tRNA ligase subunit alpha [Helicobacter winghamensis]|uniref:Phenylalanine--tRNA ligase alpha subunit n=1 Tax=Helicobacter winghamensis TaxID=157268 RepID=A0A2N3PHZ0_9HELI|nr:phenylalanine--tRNA ligase subunit alpha [Helicobacter winghamensis]EEO26152.1 phenylalanine--tRNA ligase, alpha subunit [Helicobacter winghamensis ATCC BAA-430]PKT75709.1 phenylalanine--tRNA ligase subunit alpha [Helicobacter winghamensis]PKT75918.1 phenylalanine--tRNA ligase subunit alpha [Helicobacter winghamensis]PKT76155.1 phenylalanine--tRNA ligase subunit alpha [Helicobacter winghamensis]PKT80301.1 phenylalanine--tRNA ligase subunit alpha [Helicobacter winghamensis]
MEAIFSKIDDAQTTAELEEIRILVMGKKGSLTAKFAELKTCDGESKKTLAKELNTLKMRFEKALADKKEALSLKELEAKLSAEKIDVSLFSPSNLKGANHPVMLMLDRIVEYFVGMNFALKMGPLIEDDFHNFEALNLPKYHPARDMQDTFYFKDGKLLRTHTSPVQIRTMESQKPPIRMICPGNVFRCDYDLTHTPMFHQVEGLVVESGKDSVSFAHLKFILEDFLKYMFGDVKVRFRSSFFPFTEPSAEVDMSCIFCQGKGCRVCSHTGWLEVLGCGVVDENVFRAVGYENVSGYAFGLGVERFAMLAYSVPDLRAFFESDLRILEQFK